MGLDAKARGTVGPGAMDSSTTPQTLAPEAPSCRVVAAGAVCGVSIVTDERVYTLRLSRFSPALSEPYNAGGQLSLHP